MPIVIPPVFRRELTVLGRKDICELPKGVLEHLDQINDWDLRSHDVFVDLHAVLQTQPEIREIVLAQKRAEAKLLKAQHSVSKFSPAGTLHSLSNTDSRNRPTKELESWCPPKFSFSYSKHSFNA